MITIHKTKSLNNFTVISNEILAEKKLSLPAIGFLIYLISKPDNWNVIPRHLATQLYKKESSEASYWYILDLLKELEKFGYCKKQKQPNGYTTYLIYDKSILHKQPTKKIKKEPKKTPNEGGIEEEDISFSIFWDVYPRQMEKVNSQKAFQELSDDDKKLAIYAATQYALKTDETETKFIKSPKNWLNEELYKDYTIKEDTVKQNNSYITILANKIRQVIGKYRRVDGKEKAKMLETSIEKTQLNEGGDFFTSKEQNMLLELEYTIENYDDMEFQAGEIEIILKGYFT